jgi:hypothetical protein
MQMDWQSVDGKDYAAHFGNYVFRLHYRAIVTDKRDIAKYTEDAYKLQVRDKNSKQIVFADLDYNFFVHGTGRGPIRPGIGMSVDRKYWESGSELYGRATEILLLLGYLDEKQVATVN